MTDGELKSEVRLHTISIVSNIQHRAKNCKIKNQHVINQYKNVKEWLNKNDNILIIRADKLNKTIEIERDKYKDKMQDNLSDSQTCSPQNVDHTNKIPNKNIKLLFKIYLRK